MLFKDDVLRGIERGEVTLAFRKWRRPTVKAGGSLLTPAGLLAIEEVEPIGRDQISEAEARQAGSASLAELLQALAGREGTLVRIRFRRVGDDPRIALREQTRLEAGDRAQIEEALRRLDRTRAWSRRVLELIAARPGVLAAELAASLGEETAKFKAKVRKLKALGLTESLDVGYRLSPRGVAFLGQRGPAAPRARRRRPRGAPLRGR
jgi:hypothetical protein